MAVRRFDDIDTVIVVETGHYVAIDYLSGEFDIVPFEEAAKRWLANPI